MLNWESIFATRSNRMRASEIRELLKLLDRPEIISFAGGIPTRSFFRTMRSRKRMPKSSVARPSAQHCNIR